MHVHVCIYRAGMGHGDPGSQCMLIRFALCVDMGMCCIFCAYHCMQH